MVLGRRRKIEGRRRAKAVTAAGAGVRALVLVLLALAASRSSAAAETVSIASDPWCPYVCEGTPAGPGYMVEIAQQTLGAAGYDVKLEFLPWPRAIAAVRSGKVTALLGMGVGDAPDFVTTKSLGRQVTGLAYRRGSGFHYDGIASLEHYRLATAAGVGAWGGGIDEYIAANAGDPRRVDVTAAENPYATNLRKLLAGRVDVVVDNANVLHWLAEQMKIADRIEIISIAENNDIMIGFSPDLPDARKYAKIIDDGVDRLRASGELAKIMARYGLKDWQR